MTQEDFLNAAGICGEYLYFILQNIKTRGQCAKHLLRILLFLFGCDAQPYAKYFIGSQWDCCMVLNHNPADISKERKANIKNKIETI